MGVVTTLDDPQGRPTVRDLLKGVRARVFPVGRLDYHSAGLLVLTNDGALALRLTHPRYGVRKTYEVKVKGEPQPSQLAALASGVRLDDGTTNPAEVRILRQRDQKAWLSITLAEGKNRQVRRMCEAVGLPVEKLVRVAFGALKLGSLVSGAWRHLEPAEVALLQRPPVARSPRPLRGRQRAGGTAPRRATDEAGAERGAARRRGPRAGGTEPRQPLRAGVPERGRRRAPGATESARPPRHGLRAAPAGKAAPPRRDRPGPTGRGPERPRGGSGGQPRGRRRPR